METNNLGCVCAAIYLPVCGSDGQTYSNSCTLGCEQQTNSELQQACKGECPCDELVDSDTSFDPQQTTLCFCPRLWSPVCASNGRTYANRCELQCAQDGNPDITFVRTGQC
ncbi:unnamed protein product [Orchesella dallaii]|uniref:Kazal-like domain-containing protein n=1 Tax=Orchesella dallaii TaxID=48710 RepID=A0ABP1QIP8_9HEXA